MSAKAYRATQDTIAKARALNLSEAELLEMARLAARLTHPDANHRFHQYIMWIEPDGTVTMLDTMNPEEARYFKRRTYDQRKAEEDPGEAEVEYKHDRRR